MGECEPCLRSQRKVLDSTKWHWPAELESVLVTFGNGISVPSAKAQTSLVYGGNYLALQTENRGGKDHRGIHRADGDTAQSIHTRRRVVNSCMLARGVELNGGKWDRTPVQGDVIANSRVRPGNAALKTGVGRMPRWCPRFLWCLYISCSY